jgi:hypothetical protein
MCAIFLMVEVVLFAEDMAVMALEAPVLNVLILLCHLTTPFLRSFNPPSIVQTDANVCDPVHS